MTDQTTIKETKEVHHPTEKCRVTWHSINNIVGAEGGYIEDFIEVTDETSEKARETMEKMILTRAAVAPQESQDKPKVSERASRAVEIG